MSRKAGLNLINSFDTHFVLVATERPLEMESWNPGERFDLRRDMMIIARNGWIWGAEMSTWGSIAWDLMCQTQKGLSETQIKAPRFRSRVQRCAQSLTKCLTQMKRSVGTASLRYVDFFSFFYFLCICAVLKRVYYPFSFLPIPLYMKQWFKAQGSLWSCPPATHNLWNEGIYW